MQPFQTDLENEKFDLFKNDLDRSEKTYDEDNIFQNSVTTTEEIFEVETPTQKQTVDVKKEGDKEVITKTVQKNDQVTKTVTIPGKSQSI